MTFRQRLLLIFSVWLLAILSFAAVTKLNLTTQVQGLLAIANGGTNAASAVAAMANLCPTCVTSAASLTSNAVVIGGGSQASATISADTATTHALFATAGAPAFRAIALSDLPIGTSIPAQNGGGIAQTMSPTTQNHTRLFPYFVPYGSVYTVSAIAMRINTADNSANSYDIGIYGPGCLAGTASIPLVAHTGTTAGSAFGSAAGNPAIALSGAPITGIVGGWYCLALTSSAASPTLAFGGGNYFYGPWLSNSNILAVGGATLPNTITAPATAWNGGNVNPELVFY